MGNRAVAITAEVVKWLMNGQCKNIPGIKTKIIDATQIKDINGNQDQGVLVTRINNRRKATRVKKIALHCYPKGFSVLTKKGLSSRRYLFITLEKLNQLKRYDQYTFAYFPPISNRTLPELENLMDKLRGKDGCPWDRRQHHHSLKSYLIEEAYEVIDAIERSDREALKEELGDLLLQVVFHAQIAKEEGSFHISDVIEGIITKIIRRHPHVFGTVSTDSLGEVLSSWEQIKKKETFNKTKSYNTKMPPKETYLPSLVKALKVQQKASKLGFDWENTEGALEKLQEETEELKNAYYQGKEDKIEEELGDYFFSIVNCARFLKINPEICLKKSIAKFEKRFGYVEKKVQETGKSFNSHNMEDLDSWWNEAKKFGEKRKK